MSTITLWIQLENKPSPRKYTPANLPATPNLSDLAALLCKDINAKFTAKDLEFFTRGDPIHPLPVSTSLTGIPNNSGTTLVIRYPLSSTHVHVRYNLSNSKGSVILPHTTGLWHHLRHEVYKKFEALRDNDPNFYFVHHLDDGEDGDNIGNAFQLNAIVEESHSEQKRCEISLGIRIEGRKAYGEYTLKEVSRLFVKEEEEWNNIGDAPQFDIESLPQVESEPTNTEHPKDLRLLVEENLSGTRGYGPINYLVKYMQLVVIVNEAKHRDFDQGAAQNIVQMHSALEKRTRKRKPSQNEIPFAMYGIVSVGTHWRFLRWTGSLENPVIEISRDYACQFVGGKESSKLVLRISHRRLIRAPIRSEHV